MSAELVVFYLSDSKIIFLNFGFYAIYLLNLQVIFYEALKDLTKFDKHKYLQNSDLHLYVNSSSIEGLLLGGLAAGKLCLFMLNKIVWQSLATYSGSKKFSASLCLVIITAIVLQVLVHILQRPWMRSWQDCKYKDPPLGTILCAGCSFVYIAYYGWGLLCGLTYNISRAFISEISLPLCNFV